MRAQTEAAVREADAALFLIDARAGVTPLDEEIARWLRGESTPVILAANKAEGRAGEAGILEAWALGFGEAIALSAEHGEGIVDLFEHLRPHVEREEADAAADEAGDPTLKLAIVGRPNAGKSTLINRMLEQERLITGPEAGITRDSIAIDWQWRGKRYRLVDTAGMRKKAKVQAKLERLSVGDALHSIRFADVCVLVMDAAEAFEKQDLSIGDLVIREGRALVFVLAKWDTIADPRAHFEEMKLTGRESLPQARGAPIVTIAAQSGVGLDRLMKAVEEAHDDWTARVKTKDLNDWLYSTIARHPPPAVRGKRIKPRYLTQIKARPPTFVLISSRAEDMPESYKRYLVNGLRDAFDLHAAPVRLIVKAGKNPFDES